MRKLLKRILTIIVFVSFTMGLQAQDVELNEGNTPFKIDEAEFALGTKTMRNNPMVIGPDLYIQMGEVSNYYGLSVHYSFSAFESYSGNIAEDFIVPTGDSWTVKYARYTMYSPSTIENYTGYNVTFYKDNGGKPGDVLYELIDQYKVVYEERPENANMNDVTITLSKDLAFTSGKYWVSMQAVTEIEDENSYGGPGAWAAAMLQPAANPINSQGHIRNLGQGYFPLPSYSPMSRYWEVMQGVDYGMYNFNFALYGVEKSIDLAVTAINTPETGDELSSTETVMITIQNHGLTNVADNAYKVRFRVNEGAWSDSEDGLAVTSGAEILYTLHSVADLSAKGVYDVEVELIYAEDENQDNNIIINEVENFGILYPAIPNAKVVYTTCEGTFTDHGGLGNVYVGYSRDTVVFMPGTPGSRIRLEFYDTHMSGAYPFRFYNGSSTDAPELGDWEALNSSEGIYTQEIAGLILEGTNPEGAITVIVPGFDVNASTNNFLANVTCVKNQDVDFAVSGINVSKTYSWENETIELTAQLDNRGLNTGSPLVTFMVDGVDLETVSSTIMEFGETGISKVNWTPAAAGAYTITAKVPADDGLNVDEKEFSFDHEILSMGEFVEGFESRVYPPEGWQTKTTGGSNRSFIWYNDRDRWEGKWSAGMSSDTLITPMLDIQVGDSLEFIYSAGFFGGTCNILYAPTPNGPWKTAHTVSYGLPFAKEYKASLKYAVGANYLAFSAQGSHIDYVRGPKLYFNDFDLQVVDFKGPIDPLVNTETSYDFKIRNMGKGSLSGSDYTVKLWKKVDGVTTELESIGGEDISMTNYHTFTFTHAFTTVESGNVYATIDYTADENLVNNTSINIDLTVIKAGVEYVFEGDMQNRLIDRGTLSGYYANYSEVIYHKDSLSVKGEISGISIYYNNVLNTGVKVQIYMGETILNNLEDGFLSTSAMDLVANTVIKMVNTQSKYVQVYIPFDVPYLYSGDKNLVLGFYRAPMGDEQIYSSYLLATEKGANMHRYHGMQHYEKDTDVSNPAEVNAIPSQVKSYAPNMTFYVKTTEMDASLVGTVTDETPANLEGVTLSLDGFANTTKTDVDGKYSFPVMPYGDIDVMAEFYGYYNDTITGTFTSANETVVDFTLEELLAVEVYGNIIANDSLNPIEGVEVYMQGYELEFFTVTDAKGDFTFADVYSNQDYMITFTHPKYAQDSMLLSVQFDNYKVDTVIMDELETPAFNIIADITEAGSVDVTWQTPYTGIETMVDPTLGVEFGSYWYNEPDEDVQLGNLFKVNKPGTVTSLEFSNFAWTGASEGELYLRFYNKDREEILKPVAFMMPDSTVDWAVVDVPNFTYTEDFYVMIHWNKVHQQTAAIMSHKHDDNVAYLIDGSGTWMLLTDLVGPSHSGAFSLRANVIEEGYKNSKALISYDLWRTELENSADPEMWTKMNTEPLAGTAFTDETFGTAADGYFMYAVQATYTNANSPYAYSNSINKGMFTTATVNVTANNSLDITGARVTMSHANGAAINNYYAEVANGKVEFSRVLKGDYTLEVTKGAAYEAYESSETVSDVATFNVELIEYIFTPTMLQMDTASIVNSAVFSWGLGDEKTYQVDDGSAEQALGVNADGDAQLGNFFNVNEAGQITSLDVFANNDGEGGKVSIVVYDDNQEIIGKTTELVIEGDDEGTLFNIPINFITYKGAFYVMVKYSSDETLGANSLAMDTDDNPGNAYYYDAENGFVQLGTWGYYGNFIIRAHVLVNGKKSTIVASQPVVANTNTTVSEKVTKTEIVKTVAKAGTRGVLSYNIYLDDMSTPIAEGVTSQSYTFNENDHLTVDGLHTYTAGVQAVFTTESSIVVPLPFGYDKVVGVLDILDANLVMYPNPATNNVTITNAENSTIEIYSTVGKLVKTVTSNNTMNTINVAELTNGTYIIKVKFVEGSIYRNLIINR